MSTRQIILLLMLGGATGLLALSLTGHSRDKGTVAARSAGAGAAADAREAAPGHIVWSNWNDPAGSGKARSAVRETKRVPNPGKRPSVAADLPEKVRRRLEERYQGLDVALPERGRK